MESLQDLARCARCRRVIRDIDVQNPPAGVGKHHEYVGRLGGSRWHDEKSKAAVTSMWFLRNVIHRRRARDYGTEIHRSWRRILAPLWMPPYTASYEARLVHDRESPFVRELLADHFAEELRMAIKRFDWHSQITIRFLDGDGGAGWSRSKRTITVHSGYVRRFVR